MVNTERSRRVWGWATALVAGLVLLAVPVVPAASDHAPPAETHDPAGSGQLEGTELVEEQAGIPCFRATRTLFGLRGAGTFEGATTAGDSAVYRAEVAAGQTLHADGPLQVQLENTEPYYHSPFGTHGTEAGGGAGCSPSTAATPVPAEFRIFAAEGAQDTDGDTDVDVLTGTASVYRLNATGEKVPCVGVGSFSRGGSDGAAAWQAEWTLSADCVVVGNAAGTPRTGTAPRGTFMTHHGGHAPCFDWPCPNNVKIDYQQYLPKPGPHLHLTGPTTATVGCDEPVALIARLTDTGWPAAGVPVGFSVVGPGPAVPPTGSATTDDNGEAAFSFTAPVAGQYAVTATATLDGEQVSATHTVVFANPPPPRLSLDSPSQGWQTEEQVSVTAGVAAACGPAPGVPVEFSVTWPAQDVPWTGQPTPASGIGITDATGTATFSFSGDRAGEYQVAATTSGPAGQTASDTRTVHLNIRDLKRAGALTSDVNTFKAAVVDPAGRYAYFGDNNGIVAKIDLATFERVDALSLQRPDGGAVTLRSAVIDPAGRFAYFGDFSGTVFQVDLDTFEQARAAVTGVRNEILQTAVIDPTGRFAYFSGAASESRILKFDLATFTLAAAIPLKVGDQSFGKASSALMDPDARYAYFATESGTGWVVKVDLASFQIVQTMALPNGEHPLGGVIDPDGDFAYLVMDSHMASPLQPEDSDVGARVVKIDLRTFERVGAITLATDEHAIFGSRAPAVMDPTGKFAYFATTQGSDTTNQPLPAKVVKVDLGTFERAHAVMLEPGSSEDRLGAAVIDSAGGYVYFGTDTQATVPPPARVVKVQLKRPPSPALTADADAYSTAYETPLTVAAPGVLAGDSDSDGDPLVAGQASDPAGGSVTLNPNGSFTYTPDARFAGTDTFTYTASDGMGYSAPATVSIAVAPPAGPRASSFNYYTNVSLFGGPATLRGHGQDAAAPATATSPSVTCPAGGGPASVTDADGAKAQYGPAVIFGGIWPAAASQAPPSGPLTSAVDCPADGILSASTAATLMPAGSAYPGGVGPGPFIADEVRSTCTARAGGTPALSTRILNGILETKYDPSTQEAVTTEPIPTEPPANYTRTGTIDHVGDSYRIVFNEQITHPDGSRTVNAAHMYLLGPTAVGDMVVGSSTCGPVTGPAPTAKATADFDGDGASDVSVFRPTDGTWYAQGSPQANFGAAGDIAVPADYDGDGKSDVAVFRPSNGVWYLKGSAGADTAVAFGASGDIPVPADYDGDAKADIAVFRNGVWYVKGSAGVDSAVAFGTTGDIPVPADYDGDGKVDRAVFRSGVWYVKGSAGTDTAVAFGTTGDVPVPGDYDGNGTAEVAVFRASNGVWFVQGGAATAWGTSGDIPVPGDYDGDGDLEIAVFRPSEGVWYVQGGATTAWGTNGDVPLALPAGVYGTLK